LGSLSPAFCVLDGLYGQDLKLGLAVQLAMLPWLGFVPGRWPVGRC
jgi:hypothetical protein